MIKILFLALIVGSQVFVLSSCQNKNISKKNEMLAGIEELHRKDKEASKSQDFGALLSLWTDDGVLLLPGQAPIRGIEDLKQYMERHRETSQSYEILEYTHDFQEIQIIGEWAFEWGFYTASARIKETGKVFHERGKLFRVLKRQPDGTWKVARSIGHPDPIRENPKTES